MPTRDCARPACPFGGPVAFSGRRTTGRSPERPASDGVQPERFTGVCAFGGAGPQFGSARSPIAAIGRLRAKLSIICAATRPDAAPRPEFFPGRALSRATLLDPSRESACLEGEQDEDDPEDDGVGGDQPQHRERAGVGAHDQ